MSYDRYDRNEGNSNKKLFAIIAIIAIIVASVITGLSTVVIVNQGEVAIIKTWGQVTSIQTAGFYTKNPIADSIELFDVKVKPAVMSESVGTKDQQAVTAEITVNYHIEPQNVQSVYSRFGQGIENTLIIPAIQESLKATTAKYTASEFTAIRETIKADVDSAIKVSLTPFGVSVDLVSITDFKFSDQYQQKVDDAQTSLKEAEKAQNDLATKKAEAQQQIIQAEANATATMIQAQARANATIIAANATATAMQTINQQLTPEYIEYQKTLMWNGQLPIYWGSGAMPFITIPVSNSTKP